MPKVSVIIPVYNVEKYLKQCLDSVIVQTLNDIEIICVDDGSTDDSANILNDYSKVDSRIIVLSQQNKGAGAARNKGLKIAKGECLYFLDSDDFVSPYLLEKMYDRITKTQSDICVCLNNNYIESENCIKACDWSKAFKVVKGFETFNKYDLPDNIFQFCNMTVFTKMYRTDFIRNNNIEFQQIPSCNDVFFNLYSIACASKITVLPEELVTYRTGHNNITKTRAKHINCILKAFVKTKQELKKHKIFSQVETALYSKAKIHFNYELRQLKDSKQIEFYHKKLYKFFPLVQKQKLFMRNIFSVRNEGTHKVITILGIKIKFRNNKKRRPKVSVIIPVYNTEKFLKECLDSVINQTLSDIEIFCIDDGSTDNSLQILEEYALKDSRIKLIAQKHEGVSCARNRAIKIARGEYMLCVDSDDYIKPDTLKSLYDKASKSGLDMLLFGGTRFENATGEFVKSPYYEFTYLPENFNTDCFNHFDCIDFITRMAVTSGLTIYRLKFIKKYNINFPPHLYFEDNYFFTRAFLNAQKCGILNKKFLCKRIREGSITQTWEDNHLDYVKISGLILNYLKSINIDEKLYDFYNIAYSNNVVNIYNRFDESHKKNYFESVKRFVKKYNVDYLGKISEPSKEIIKKEKI